MEELDEIDVLWPEYCTYHTHAEADQKPLAAASMPTSRLRRPCAARSRPVDIPVPSRRGAVLVIRWKDCSTQDDLEADCGGGGSKMVVPPHLLVSGGESTAVPYASLPSGQQRKRPRELRHLRNSVLRMTGFIEG